ncbi:helix-turn-helix domain-containing protein [Draconibacterium orientale]|uniref:helix-turn-helix domain-containing protein n=1 Tax=Draconibacterium orientale TaxID=1168034 RepID=UPI002A0A4DE2|nr:helix-turn-helix domain-containing protein [Draconibacterium orientale]
MHLTFEQIPEAIGRLEKSQERIEKLVTQLTENASIDTNIDKLLTVSEAAEFLSLSVPTIYTMVHKGQIPYNKKTKRLYFLKSQLTEWIKQGREVSELDNDPVEFLKPQKKRS